MSVPEQIGVIERFLLFLAAEKGLSANYRISVRQSLTHFFHWMGQTRRRLEELQPSDLVDYHHDLLAEGLASSSCRVMMVHLRIFLRYLTKSGVLSNDPASLVSAGRVGMALPQTLSSAIVQQLLESIDPHDLPYGARDRAMLEMFYGSGLRVSD